MYQSLQFAAQASTKSSNSVENVNEPQKAIKSQLCALCKNHGKDVSKKEHKRCCPFEKESHWQNCLDCYLEMCRRDSMKVMQYFRRAIRIDKNIDVDGELQQMISKKATLLADAIAVDSILSSGQLLNGDEMERFKMDETTLREFVDQLSDKTMNELLKQELFSLHCVLPEDSDFNISNKFLAPFETWKSEVTPMKRETRVWRIVDDMV